ncbi:glycerol-3- phosphate dehydrogenase (NAD+) [Acrasis kona]|uniref:Glycerol-3-phosphate dehydrogenase [NAD(+)] n=1 Tax=Acrasis kona TaxID=1008807 RepID=A0AAW2ZEM5_9EUKA
MTDYMMNPASNVLVIGSGNFGTALAFHLASLNDSVRMWSRDTKVVEGINSNHKNIKYLTHVTLPDNLSAVGPDFTKEMFKTADVVLMSIPTQHLRHILTKIKPFIRRSHLLIMANKGIENSTLELPCSIVEGCLGEQIAHNTVYLSGPSFAAELVVREPTCVTVASKNAERSAWAQKVFHCSHFRVYLSSDIIGVELAGSIKNVLAIASGISTGLGYQSNTRAALLTRGLSEMTRMGVKLGCDPLTMCGLSGVGDLFLTCTSEKSRNFTVGLRLAQGMSLEEITKNLGSVAEGVATTKSAHQLCRKLKVYSPIIDEVYQVLYHGKCARDAVDDLLNIEPLHELHMIR